MMLPRAYSTALGLILVTALLTPMAFHQELRDVPGSDPTAVGSPLAASVTPQTLAGDTVTISRTTVVPAGALDYHVYLPVMKRSAPTVYWGTYVSANIYGIPTAPPWDMSAVDVFESHAGKKITSAYSLPAKRARGACRISIS